jgi:hypothetical protein
VPPAAVASPVSLGSTGGVPGLPQLGTARSPPRPLEGGARSGGATEETRERPIQEPETRKTASGATPGGLRIRLLLKETVREPLGGSLLLGIRARIEANGAAGGEGHGGEHAAAGLAGRTAEDGREKARAIRLRLLQVPRAQLARTLPPELLPDLLTEHGQARMRLLFRREFLQREDHGTVTTRLLGGGLLEGRLLAVDAPGRSGIQLVARVSGTRKILNRESERTRGSPSTPSNAVHLFRRIVVAQLSAASRVQRRCVAGPCAATRRGPGHPSSCPGHTLTFEFLGKSRVRTTARRSQSPPACSPLLTAPSWPVSPRIPYA